MTLRPEKLRCEYLKNPLGIDVDNPRLSWLLEGDGRNRQQSAFRIVVARRLEALRSPDRYLWDSGQVKSDRSLDIRYQGPPLENFERVWWSVCSWDESGNEAWSRPAFWEAGIRDRQDWVSDWITGPVASSGGVPAPGREHSSEDIGWLRTAIGSGPVQYLRKQFRIDRPVRRARAYATARGLYQLLLNGESVDNRSFAPGWTDYHQRIEYQAYDIGDQLREGANVLNVLLAEGWYAGYVGFTPRSRGAHYGNRPYFLALIVLEFDDGETAMIASDSSWTATLGPIVYSDLLMGEHYDARREIPLWHTEDYDDANDYPVHTHGDRGATLVSERAEAIRVVDELRPKSLAKRSAGSYVFDFGQNIVGRVRLQLEGAAGQSLTIRHGEALHEDGSLYIENLRSAKAEDVYVFKGDGVETYEPTFTYHGFRYVELSGLDSTPDLSTLTARVLSSATSRTGEFHCSSPLVNQLYSNILWSQRGNFISIPTDCPQRDERLGWLGDAQIFAATAMFNHDVAAFFTKWMYDVEDAQLPDGAFTDIAPLILFDNGGSPGWAEAGIIIPWTMYLYYGDHAVIERHWDAMTAWMDYVARHDPDFIRGHGLNLNFGDWLSIEADTPKSLIATAYYAYSAQLLSRMARAIGRSSEEKQYAKLNSNISEAFVAAYVTNDGTVAGKTQTGYLLALAFDLLPESLRSKAAAHLVADIEAHDGRLSTGFLGTKLLAPILSQYGYSNVAFQLLLSEKFPSWGYCIKHGATTIWERWDSWTPDDGFQVTMNSFNHYSLGSIGEWLYGYLGGIRPDIDNPGFKHIIIAPQIEGGIDSCDTAFRSRYGGIRVAWENSGEGITLTAIIPPNSSATVELPLLPGDAITESGQPVNTTTGGIQRVERSNSRIDIGLGSGNYLFRISKAGPASR